MRKLKTNLQVLKPSRKAIKVGDVFVLQMRQDEFFFGRVIDTPMIKDSDFYQDVNLVYIYDARSSDKNAIPPLDKSNLLVPPFGTDRMAWSWGFFETVARRPLEPKDVFEKHCFGPDASGRYRDKHWNEISSPFEPLVASGTRLIHGIDSAVSDALNIPRVVVPSPSPDAMQEKLAALVARARRAQSCESPAMRRLLQQLMDRLEVVGKTHGELYDTEAREAVSDAILEGFIYDNQSYDLPEGLGMFSAKANAAVREALGQYITGALAQAEKENITTAAERMVAFQDIEVKSKAGQSYDDFFGAYA